VKMNAPEPGEVPTPQPLTPVTPADEHASLFERLLHRRKLIVAIVGIGLVIVVVSGMLLWTQSGSDLATPGLAPSLRDLAEQYPELASLLNDPTLGSVYKEFVLAYENEGVEAARELAAKRGLLNERDEIRITLVVDSADYVPALKEELQQAGIVVEGSYRERINVGVPLSLIEQLAAQQGTDALFKQLTQMGHIIRLELPTPRGSDSPVFEQFQSEGVSITGASAWHDAGFTGQSVRIGVLDLGFDGYRALLGTELPEQVVAESFIYGKEPDESGEVHGTACTEIVHDMAPDAELYLAAYDSTLVSMGQAVDWLLSQGVQIISNSTSGVVGPMDGSDDAAAIVDEAAGKGVLWVNSSGNAADEHYRGRFLDTDEDGLHEFSDGTEMMALDVYAPDLIVALNWDDWQQATEDYDLFIYGAQGDLLASSEDAQSGLAGQEASELIVGSDISEGIYYVAVKAISTTRAGTLDLYTLGAIPEFPVAEHSLGSPADARGSLAVGATESRDGTLAVYSSQGPSNDGRLKPELSAPAGVSSATYAPEVFEGTSASTPHVAGAAALAWSAFPDDSADQVRDYLQTNALDLGSPGPDSGYGYGRLLLPSPPGESTAVPPVPTATPSPAPVATEAPPATLVALVPGSPEKPVAGGASRGNSLLLVGAVGLFGGAVALGGGALLLIALLRPTHRTVPAAPARENSPPASWADRPVAQDALARPLAPPEGEPRYGALVGPGRISTTLRPGLISIGRSPDNDVVLQEPLVSRRHARIECAEGRCAIEDLGSANGLFVNGRRVKQATLAPGDRLRLGNVELVYQGTGQRDAGTWLEMGKSRYPVSPEGIALGRSHDSDVHVGDVRASRRHARIDLEYGVFVITDLGSANGTFVNGQRVQRQSLRDGDEIKIGDATLHFRTSSFLGS
jgi:pSer/pThr/pTyr-binding forkhead associated (FHA) protein